MATYKPQAINVLAYMISHNTCLITPPPQTHTQNVQPDRFMQEYSLGYSYITYLAVQREGEHRKSNVPQKLDFLRLVASAKRSGQEDFQRGTPPVSLASRSMSPFLRACIITEWSSTDHETGSTGTSILIPLLLLNFNMRLHGTLRLGIFFWLQIVDNITVLG